MLIRLSRPLENYPKRKVDRPKQPSSRSLRLHLLMRCSHDPPFAAPVHPPAIPASLQVLEYATLRVHCAFPPQASEARGPRQRLLLRQFSLRSEPGRRGGEPVEGKVASGCLSMLSPADNEIICSASRPARSLWSATASLKRSAEDPISSRLGLDALLVRAKERHVGGILTARIRPCWKLPRVSIRGEACLTVLK